LTHRWFRVAVAAALLGAVFAGASATATAAPAKWRFVASPPLGTNDNLSDISCARASRCFAVGYAFEGATPHSVIEQWRGLGWAVAKSPNPGRDELNGVSCVGARQCVAVGNYDATANLSLTLIETWDGTSWTQVPSPSPAPGGNALYSVSCSGPTFCAAVGSSITNLPFQQTLTEVWNGLTWSTVPSPDALPDGDNVLLGVSCAGPVSCFAVGTSTADGVSQPVIERWNGTRWTLKPVPSPGGSTAGFVSVSCVSPALCAAVGFSDQAAPFIELFDGTTWTVASDPTGDGTDPQLFGVSCPSEQRCVAVGAATAAHSTTTRNLIEVWDGATWSVVGSMHHPRTSDALNRVACVTVGHCVAVGQSRTDQTYEGFVLSGRP
jgi:hypothetical protein